MAYSYETALEHGKFHRRFKGSFTPNGAAVSSAAGATRGTGFAPSWVATGVYRVTLEEPFARLVAAKATFQAETAFATQYSVTIGDVNVANRTVDLILWTGGAKADVAASGVLRRVNFELTVAVHDGPGSGATA